MNKSVTVNVVSDEALPRSVTVENYSGAQPRDSHGRWSSGGGGGGGSAKMAPDTGGGSGGGGEGPSGAARGKIVQVTIDGKTVDSATVVDVPDSTLSGREKTTRSVLLRDHVAYEGEQGNVVHIDPKGRHFTLKTKSGGLVKLNPNASPKLDEKIRKADEG